MLELKKLDASDYISDTITNLTRILANQSRKIALKSEKGEPIKEDMKAFNENIEKLKYLLHLRNTVFAPYIFIDDLTDESEHETSQNEPNTFCMVDLEKPIFPSICATKAVFRPNTDKSEAILRSSGLDKFLKKSVEPVEYLIDTRDTRRCEYCQLAETKGTRSICKHPSSYYYNKNVYLLSNCDYFKQIGSELIENE